MLALVEAIVGAFFAAFRPKEAGDADATLPSPHFWVFVVRWVFFFLAAGALVSPLALGRRDAGRDYVCPMHSHVRSQEPGECPLCGMALRSAATESQGAMSSLPRRKDVAQGTIPPSIDVMGDSSGDGTAIARLLKGSRELRRAAWVASEGRVEALFHDDEVETLGIGAEATFSPSRAPEVRVRLIRTSLPPVGAHRSTSWLAFDIQGDATATHPGEAGWVLATALTREILTIPSSAVQPSPTGPYVFVSSGKVGAFTRRDIQIGDDDHGLVSVISGLRKGERVATRNAFFLDAELLLRADSASAFSR